MGREIQYFLPTEMKKLYIWQHTSRSVSLMCGGGQLILQQMQPTTLKQI